MSTEAPEQPEAAAKPHPGRTPEAQGSVIPVGWKPTAAEPVPVVRCVQIKANGERCGRWSLRGYTKCYRHSGGGNFPNVKAHVDAVLEAARLRLVGDADQAIDVLEDLMQPGVPEGIRLKASTEVLDRAGVRGGYELSVDVQETVNPGEELQKRLSQLQARAGVAATLGVRAKPAEDDETDVVDAEVVSETDHEQLDLFGDLS